ncbi:SH3 domain-containing protein [Rhynchospora pubera]|uniref:SH3 domain-containing protein n=1 Tax=Rhynchospora pubera TaxID=906938 RepID=A0AAV8HSR3_9POAL|nr:SH3 domain-containing protein [Rhynchospora pubera]
MVSPKEKVAYSSFPKLTNPIETNSNSKTNLWVPQVSPNTNTYPAIDGYDSAAEEEEQGVGESGIDGWAPLPASNRPPEVNLRNVLLGLIAIVTGRNKSGNSSQKSDNSGISFLGSNSNGDSFLLPSVYLPSAPPLLGEVMNSVGAHKSVLEAEPPEWLPDSSTSFCMQCSAPFAPLTRGRHHCRFCGGVFCRVCTKGRCLLPRKFRVRDPQRVCDGCYDRLDPVQGLLLNQVSNASQTAKHDVMDWTSMRGWLNLPVGMKMEDEIYKAANTLRSFTQVARFNPEKSIPQAVLSGASGLAVLTVVKAGAVLTYKVGTGLVVARRSDGSWSAPSAILSLGLGWGAQIGGELMDFVIVLHGSEAVKTFTSRMHFSLGAGLSAAAGPIGRVLEADLRTGERGTGVCYTYSCSKGAFVGVSLEGNFVMTRIDANLRFYGDPYLTTTDILLGTVDRPKAAGPLYSALDDLFSKINYL